MDARRLQEFVAGRWPQHAILGVATTAMLAAAGLTDKLLTAAVARGVLVRLHRGAYIQSTVWSALPPWRREDTLLAGHVLASRSQGAYSHSSAARLHGLRTWGCGSVIHLTHAQSTGTSGASAKVSLHEQELGPGEIDLVRFGSLRVPVTSKAQTVLDCGRLFDLERAVVIGDHALRTGVTVEKLQALLAASGFKRGAARARKLLEFIDGKSESPGESRTRVFLARTGLPMPQPQVEIETRHGRHRADFAWREFRLILEFDGWGKYFDYRPTDEAVARERQREKDLMELGWRFIRIAWRDLDDPTTLEARIRGALNQAGAQLPAVRTKPFL